MNIVYEYSANYAEETVYYYGINRTHNSEGEIYVYNAHGDVVQLVKDNAVIASYTYDAFGNLTSTIGTSDNPFRYCGEYFDTETETYYLRARYYNPANGRFTQQDAWAFMDTSNPLTLNLYTYCCCNPISYHDPSGHFWETFLDVVSLGFSIVDVCKNPTDPMAWLGLVGDIVDVAIPCVGGIGEIIDGVSAGRKAAKAVSNAVDAVDDVTDAVKAVDRATDAAKAADKVVDGAKVVDNVSDSRKAADILAQNRVKGLAYEQTEFDKFSSKYNNAQKQITIKTASGKTRVDAIGFDNSGNIVIYEFKSSATAPLTKNQKRAFPEIYKTGGTVVGKGKGVFEKNFKIRPGTKVKVIRPEVF